MNIVKSIDNVISNRILNTYDYLVDKHICGKNLVKYVPSIYRDDKNGIGMTGSQSTHYTILKRIFSNVSIHKADHILDVGCGKGRVISFLLKQKVECSINGIEINEISGNVAKEWTKQYAQVMMTVGDAFLLDYDNYTILFLGRPFLPKTFLEFIQKIEKDLTHPITLIYWVDQQSGHLLKDRNNWSMLKREKLSRIHGLKIAEVSQSYSIWTYDPT